MRDSNSKNESTRVGVIQSKKKNHYEVEFICTSNTEATCCKTVCALSFCFSWPGSQCIDISLKIVYFVCIQAESHRPEETEFSRVSK